MGVSDAEDLLAFQLKAAGIAFEREYRFNPPRRWRFDFVFDTVEPGWACEVEGGAWTGGHKRGRAADTDTEKANAAVMAGWRVLRFTPAQIHSGEALDTIERALGR